MAVYNFISSNSLLKESSPISNIPSLSTTQKDTANNGGVLGGIAYSFEKLGLGFLSGIEGIWDFTAGGLADLFGADEWAEEQFANDWVNYNHADEWFDPSEGWRFVGDVAGGIGTSLPSIAAATAVGFVSGGTLAPVAASMLAAGLSAAGNATKEAYLQTGELGSKEYLYGALTGVTEAGIEGLTAGIGTGTGRIIRKIGENAAQRTAKSVVSEITKTSAFGIFKELGKDFISEGIEEGLAEILSPVYKKLTYDPNAENATWQEIGYAATVGAFSGLFMSGGNTVISKSTAYKSGSKAAEEGRTQKIIDDAKAISESEDLHKTGYKSFENVKELYGELSASLESTNNEVTTAKQKILLGELNRANVAAMAEPYIERSVRRLVASPESIAQRYTELGMTDMSGNKIEVTAEQILSGIDTSLANSKSRSDRIAFAKQLRKAFSENSVLRTLAIADATGHIFMDMNKFSEAVMSGKKIITDEDVQRFIEKASDSKKRALAERLGIEDWNKVDINELNRKVAEFLGSEQGQEYKKQRERITYAVNAAGDTARPLPHILRGNMANGVYTYKEGSESIALIKQGDTYSIYDYQTGSITQPTSIKEVNKALREFWNNKNSSAEVNGQSQGNLEKSYAFSENDSRIVQDNDGEYVELNLDSEIQKELSNATEAERGKIVERELKKAASEGEYTFHDGTVAIMDNKDISKIGHTKYEPKNRTAISLRNLVKVARFIEENLNVVHDKFKSFKYYRAKVKVGETFYECVLNVGLGKFDNRYHIHDINQFYEKNRSGSPILSNPRKSGDHTVRRTTTSTDSISQTSEKINSSQEKTLTLPEIMKLANDNIKGYEKLNEPNKLMVRGVIRRALANGFSEGDALHYARVSARAGINVRFDKARCATEFVDDQGNVVYADGFYSRSKNEIVVNPEGTRSASALLIHELTHAICKTRSDELMVLRGVENLSEEQKKSIVAKYGKLDKNKLGYKLQKDAVSSSKTLTVADEMNAHYAEGMLSNKNTLEKLLEDKPTIKDKILNFFKGAESDYAGDEILSKEARKLYRQYKKLFDKFAESNQGNNVLNDTASARLMSSEGEKRYAISSNLGAELDRVLNGTFDASKNEVYIGTTSNFMTDVIGAEGLELYMPAAKAYSSLVTEEEYNKKPYYSKQDNYHGIGKEKFIEILERSESPIAAFASAPDEKGNKRQNRIVLVTDEIIRDVQTNKDGYAVVIEEVDTTGIKDGKRVKANKAITVYPRTQIFADIQNSIIDGRILEMTKKGEHLFAGVRGSNPQAAIRKDVLKNNIADFWANVKWLKEKNKKTSSSQPKTITPMQAALQKSGYIDQDGHIKYMQNVDDLSLDDGRSFALPENMDPSKVTVSKGTLIKQKANYESEKVFSKKDITETLGEIKAFAELRTKVRENIIDRLWQGYNSRVDEQGYEKYTLVMKDKLFDELYEPSMTDEEVKSLKKQIKLALDKIVENGKPSIKSRMKDTVMKEAKSEVTKDFQLFDQIGYKANQMKDLKLGTFLNATQYKPDIFKGSVETLANIMYRGTMSVKKARNAVANLKEWYTTDNPMLMFESDQNSGLYVKGVAEMLEELSVENKTFSRQDLKMLLDVMSYFVKFVENYNKVWKQGKWVDAKPEAERYIDIINRNNSRRLGAFLRLTGMKYVESYIETFGDPSSVVRRVDMYEDGFFTSMFEELRSAAVRSDVSELTVKTDYYAFLDSHKKYLENAAKETITWQGEEISKLHAIGLAMTLKRAHAHAGILYNGITYFDEKGKMRRVGGVLPNDQILNAKQLAEVADDQRKQIEGQFSEADKEYMSILEKGYNGDVRQLKVDRDMERLGFTNATEGYYYPIRRANAGKGINIDRLAAEEMDRVSSASFNKNTVKGAKQELFIESADALYNRHVHTVCQYAHLSPALDTFNVLFNLDTSGNPNKPISVRTESKNTWKNGEEYFRKLITDIQGISPRASEGKELLSLIRSSYAKYQLGANPKVWATQFSSILASGSILDADSITRGMTISASDVDKYCSLAWLRNSDNTAVMAQGNLDKMKHSLDKVSTFLMTPIGKVDRIVVCRLFGACQAQVEKNGGGKVGTEKNKVASGELLEKVLLETQQNSMATERSAAMRSQSEIMRTFTMFSSDAMKVVGRVIDSFGEISALRARIKAETDTSVRSELEKRLTAASRKAKKSTAALALSSMFMAALAQLFRFIYDKEQEEDEIVETIVVDTIGNMFGGLPIIRDAISYLTDGYELENYTYSTLNDLLSASKNMLEIPGMIISGEASSQDIAKATKNLSFALGQITGLPVRNIYNVLYGLTKRFSPRTAYKIDNVFYEKNYKTDLYKAIEENDTQMVNMLMSMLYNERMGDTMSENVHNELYNLSMKGYKVMPKAVASKINYNEEEIELSAEQQDAIRQSYSSSQGSLQKLFSNAKYKALSDEDKVQAIKYVYELHYDSAFETVLGIDGGKSVLLNNVFSADILALYYIITKELDSDKDKDGKTISGTKKKKVVAAIKSLGLSTEEQLLLICAKGYSISDSDVGYLSSEVAKKRLLRYILNLKNVSKEVKASLAEMSGFEVKDGKIVQNFAV